MQEIGNWKQVNVNDLDFELPRRTTAWQHKDNPELLGYIRFQGKRNGEPDPRFITRIETLKDLDHPNILNLLDYDLEAERPYLVTELCRGGTLKSVDLSTWTIKEKQLCFYQICRGFAYLWEHGLTKSDHNFKNIFLKEDNTPVIGDFESAHEILTNAEGVIKVLSQMGYTFWEIMEGKKFNQVQEEERRLNEQIEELTSQLEDLKQQKAQLLS
jgi:serine/threonine protein kinase